jgi:microcin C transport system substrate-binding protein
MVMRLFALALMIGLAALRPPGAEAASDVAEPPVVRIEDGQKVYRAHAIAMHGLPKYPADFAQFDYVNPEAPTGGEVRLGAIGTFDNFNRYIPKGNAAGPGSETLLVGSADEPFTLYGLIAEEIEWPEDRSWVIFHLRPEARWHDGQAITVADVIFSLEILKEKGHPFYRFYYQSIATAEQVGPRAVKFSFADEENREMPLIAGQLPILPKHYWETRDFAATTLEPPLGSGAYRIREFEVGRDLVVERVEDYWGKDLPVSRGRNNFDRVKTIFFRDATVLREALKSGDLSYREENQAKAWALQYDLPSVREGWLRKEEVAHQRPTGMQAFIFNTRRPPFDDRKLREALAYAFDFEWTNPVLFFGQYTRNHSFFSNSELASRGLPEGEELEILERYRSRLPEEIFTEPFKVSVSDGGGWPRDNQLKALGLLEEAGWEVRDMKLVDAETGQPFRFEILLVNTDFERIVLPFARNLARLGIEARVRLVDQSQYINRTRDFDFDMIVAGWGQSDSPGNEQRLFWTTAAADSPAARNFPGIKDPIIDELVELVIQAPSRESLVQRTRALDRVLLWGHYVIPAWHLQVDRLLYWDRFSRPEVTPKNGTTIDLWWFDAAKSAALDARRKRGDRGESAEAGGGWGMTLAVMAGLLLAGFFVFRYALRRPQH